MKNRSTIILGAGPAGLAAAYEAVKQGMKPLVLEKSDRVGGIARTETYKDYHFDIGGHRFFTKIKRIESMWREILGPDLLRVNRISRIYHQGRFYKYPPNFFNMLTNLGIIECLLALLSYCVAQLRTNRAEENFEQWVSNRFGQRLYQIFFKTYTEKVLGIPCHNLRAEWAAHRIGGFSFLKVLTKSLTGVQNARTLIDTFDYPLKGPSMMWERLRGAIETGGGKLWFNATAVAFEHKNGRIKSVTFMDDSKKSRIPVEHLISSIPLPKLLAQLEPSPPKEILRSANGLSYRSFILVGLIINEADLFSDQWLYIHNPDLKVGRIQNFKNWSTAMVPDPQKTSIGMEFFCNEEDDIWRMSANELINLASLELSDIGLAKPDQIIDAFVVRQPGAYPIYDEGYRRRLNLIRGFLKTITNLQTVGRNGLHRYNNMDHAMQTGIFAVENILGANHDLWQENVGKESL